MWSLKSMSQTENKFPELGLEFTNLEVLKHPQLTCIQHSLMQRLAETSEWFLNMSPAQNTVLTILVPTALAILLRAKWVSTQHGQFACPKDIYIRKVSSFPIKQTVFVFPTIAVTKAFDVLLQFSSLLDYSGTTQIRNSLWRSQDFLRQASAPWRL